MKQRTDEWHAARLGKLTASRMYEALTKKKTGWGTGRAKLMGDLLAERLTEISTESYTSPSMWFGIDNEGFARKAYAFYCDATIEETGFIDHPTIEGSGCSPDGLVGDDGLVEIICPNSATHIETLVSHTVPMRKAAQIMWQLACTGRAWCDFVSFDPRMPEPQRLFVKRVHRNEQIILGMEEEVRIFIDEMEAKLRFLRSMELVVAA